MAEGKILSWGKCKVTACGLVGTGVNASYMTIEGETEKQKALEFGNPVEGSTQLTTTQGDKVEAKVEGGAIDAARYNANTYELTYQIRYDSNFTMPLDGVDGVVSGEFEVFVIPEENASAKCVHIKRASCNVGYEFTSENGIIVTYTFSSLKVETGQQIEVIATPAAIPVTE